MDELLHQDRVCDVILPRIQKRYVLEENEELEPRVSALYEYLKGKDSNEEFEDEPESDRDYLLALLTVSTTPLLPQHV